MLNYYSKHCALKSKNTNNFDQIQCPEIRNSLEISGFISAPSRALVCADSSSSPPSALGGAFSHCSGKDGASNVHSRRRKTSHALTRGQVRLIVQGLHHAERIGCAPNRFVTIDWDLAGIADPWTAKASYLKSARDWLLKRDGWRLTYVWVVENGARLGLHSHILLYIPPYLIPRFNQLQRRWLKKAGVNTLRTKGIIHSKPIGLSYSASFDTGTGIAAYRHNLTALAEYILKGADPVARRTFAITRQAQFSEVTGKRAGTSRNIGAKAIADYRAGL